MLIWLSLPLHPEYQGGLDQNSNLFQIWKERLNNLIPLDDYWIKHQKRYSEKTNKIQYYFILFLEMNISVMEVFVKII
jgi:hypothetical protein